jgi:hypothetical protein
MSGMRRLVDRVCWQGLKDPSMGLSLAAINDWVRKEMLTNYGYVVAEVHEVSTDEP